ncbi:hypothetical protein B1992_12835 [Pseudoxanthomonas broegbernensis]|uniref:Caspase domain-containing protein n=1 Tax=Pseudoxanthomonas broegbernensis TaxID=83619 RepID=A0A7V8GKQ9_9GAMM|nr:hypothetical protein [Pseudoxanthomonas broegbernensis]KAF1685259.1 hypothetical protein B1992_12835 [Pseudoxanthomonas broegbernensis]MBB6066150.1 hypothetical protein [Pseudoxanthomonas broegbernensis]
MIRAGIFVGVDRTGQLQQLHDAASGARRMHDWAIGAGMIDPGNAKLITDASGPVHPDHIYEAIGRIVNGPGVDQLILYFAGHGVNINRSEVWLLSDAPERTSAAVNVRGSVDLARYCGIPHVVVISDACRVAPEGIQAQNVVGQDVFPNNAASDRSHPVDQLFACRLGRTAAEILDPGEAAGSYTALYTEELLHALQGRYRELLDAGADAADPAHYLYPRRLARHLEAAIPRIVAERKLIARVNQVPDAIITSDALWLARIEAPPAPAGAQDTQGAAPAPAPRVRRHQARRASPGPVTYTKSILAPSGDRLADIVARHPPARPVVLPGMAAMPGLHDPDLRLSVLKRIAAPFGPDRFESQCGIKVRGIPVALAMSAYADVRRLEGPLPLIRVDAIDGPAASVLLQFADGTGTLVPAIRGYVASLTFEEGELVDLAWEPSTNHPRWDAYAARKDELRALRALAASASRNGRFRLDVSSADTVGRDMRYMKSLDPALALYAAYAYHEADLDPAERIGRMSRLLCEDIDASFFDLALLSRQLRGRRVVPTDMIVPPVPLLSQGWTLLRAHGVKPHPALEGLESTVRQSLWSLYDPRGVDRIKQALSTREVR